MDLEICCARAVDGMLPVFLSPETSGEVDYLGYAQRWSCARLLALLVPGPDVALQRPRAPHWPAAGKREEGHLERLS